MDNKGALVFEENVISLRTAMVLDDGNFVTFRLRPRWQESSIPRSRPKNYDWVLLDVTHLYRHLRSASGEKELTKGFFPVERAVKPLVFEKPPEFKLLWADSGNSVALYLNEEPWAFIDEKTQKGYSKGILKPTVGNPWNQRLFIKIFGANESR